MQFLSFTGNNHEDVVGFLQNVDRIALTAGTPHDNDWLVDYIVTCLSGPALSWYVHLDENTQRSWKELHPALLQRFTMPERAGVSVTLDPSARTVLPPSTTNKPSPPPAQIPKALQVGSFPDKPSARFVSPREVYARPLQ
ncbi:hypothetical protein FRB93_014043 [Tulasnella sp. JGI-2019a]|nr:hypothetical protein FRB93_014043 [Tulasnella sp. JGI-2019a]